MKGSPIRRIPPDAIRYNSLEPDLETTTGYHYKKSFYCSTHGRRLMIKEVLHLMETAYAEPRLLDPLPILRGLLSVMSNQLSHSVQCWSWNNDAI